MVGQQIWTDFDPPDWLAGGGLLNRTGKLVAVHGQHSGFGGTISNQLINVWSFIGRLRAGEIWGRWGRGSGPVTGMTLMTSPDGVTIRSLAAGVSAAAAGLQPGDAILRIDGKPVQVLDDAVQAVAEKDPGATISVEFRRAGNTATATVVLSPRTP